MQVLPLGWRKMRAEEVAAPEKGSVVSGPFGSNIGKRFFVEEGVPVIRGNNLKQGDSRFVDGGFVFITEEKAYELRNCAALPEDLVFTAAGTLGQVGLIPKHPRFPRYIISNKQLRLRCNRAIASPAYLYYWFTAPQMRLHISNQNTGASIPLITLGTLRNLPVDLPPLAIQDRIASILSAYDDLIDNNTRRIKILDAIAQMIYGEWFVNFRFPGHEKVSEMVSTETGPIPEGWGVRSLDSLMDFQGGAQPPKAEWSEEPRNGYVRMIQIRDYQNDNHIGYVADSRQLRKCSELDIMIARYGASVGRICWGLEGAYNVALVRVIPARSYLREFLRSVLISESIQSLLIGMSGRTAQAGFNKSILPAIRVPLPQDTRILERYEEIAGSIRRIQLTLNKATKNLKLTRDFLLPKLMSGETNVGQVERQVAAQGA